MNTSAPRITVADLPHRAVNQQAAVMALLTLLSPGLDVPEAVIDVDPSRPRVMVSVHGDPAGFEWWRESLGLSPDAAGDLAFYDDLGCCCVRIAGRIGSTEVQLVGYLPLPAETTADSDAV